MTLSTYGIGVVSYIKDPTLFITIGIIMRFLQGMGDILLQITILTVFT
jgi:hypothetical protein